MPVWIIALVVLIGLAAPAVVLLLGGTPVWLLVVIVAASAVLLIISCNEFCYGRRAFVPLSDRPPKYNIGLKYEFRLGPCDAATRGAQGVEALTRVLQSFRLRVKRASSSELVFVRGAFWQGFYTLDFDKAPLRVVVELPLSPATRVRVQTLESWSFVGKQWELAHEIKEHIQEGALKCRTCHYSLRGNKSGLCPECGSSAQVKKWQRAARYEAPR